MLGFILPESVAPEQGPLCPHFNTHLPHFIGLTSAQEQRIYHLLL